jgi:hypothetical protein
MTGNLDAPTWTILVPTIPVREPLFLRLMDRLLPQLDEHGGRVRVLAWRNAGRPRLAEIRDAMVAGAGSEYVSFVDDDDLVPDYYVSEIVRAIAGRPDHVGFQLEYTTHHGGKQVGHEIVDHSVRHGRWHRNVEGRLVRDLTHIDPIRRDIALRGRFAAAKRGRAEDTVWVKQVRGHVHSEEYINKIMYHYIWSHEGSSWGMGKRVAPGGARPDVVHPDFSWHPLSDA